MDNYKSTQIWVFFFTLNPDFRNKTIFVPHCFIMKIFLAAFTAFLLCQTGYSQNEEENTELIVVDSLYREDQFYFGFTFNLMNDLPSNVNQSGFSGGLHLGIIRDMPINERRNWAIGAGLGWSINTYSADLFIGEDENDTTIFQSLKSADIGYDSNRFTTYLVEAPIEIRWRTSAASTYTFWRVYAGIKFGYIYYFKSNFKQPGNEVVQTKVDELNRFRMGLTLSAGFNKVNFYCYYGLNPFFDGKMPNGEDVGVKTVKIGLIFYIL